MAENEAPQGASASENPASNKEQAPQETDWKAESRKWESRAKESLAAAKANEDAAKRLAEIENAQKTADQKNADRLAKLEGDLEAERLGRVRAEVAAEKKVPAGLLTGSTREELEAAADALVQFKGEQPRMGVVPGEGKQPAQKKTTADLFAEAIGDAL